ncbi:MAG: ribose-phosphate pyrophosphokinase [Firmicutes bacterium]|nr:ribose-phosphate pyrophosphokinase [Bacillota bacterium]
MIAVHGNKIQLFAGNASKKLGAAIADKLKINLSKLEVGKFSDGECSVHIGESVRGADVFVVQSTSYPVNDNLMELLVIIDALRRASAARITAVIPYFGYARQDRKARARDPITAKLVADIIETSGADRVLTMDLHAPQLQGFFDIPVDHLLGMPVLCRALIKDKLLNGNAVVVSPDVGSVNRARQMAQKLNCPLAIVDKRRPHANSSEVMHIVGDVKGKVCLLVDDMIDTAGTITNSAKALVEVGGATKVFCACTHPVLSGKAMERLTQSNIEKIYTLDTIELPPEKKIPKIIEVSVASIFSEAIESIFADKPVSKLYEV